MDVSLTAPRSRIARALAALALLFATGLQVQELGHHHAVDDVQAQCLLCKSSGEPSAHAALELPPITLLCAPPASAPTLPPRRVGLQVYCARGPPVHS